MLKSKSCGKLFTSQINSYEKRTPIEILYRNLGKWQNMAQIDKKTPTNSGIMQSQRKTGGRPAARPPTTTTAKIISLR